MHETIYSKFVPMKNAWAVYFACVAFALSGCLTATTQHFNSGAILPAGETRSTYGLAWIPVTNCYEPSGRNADGFNVCHDYEQENIPLPSYTWSLGVRDQWGPFPGAELGWMVEALGTIDFNANLGLPGFENHPKWRHAIMAGWGIGNWADNTLFLEYAISFRPETSWLLYTNFRTSYVATSLNDLELSDQSNSNDKNVFLSHQRWLFQNTWGVRVGPIKVRILPKYYDLNVHMGAPKIMFPGGVPSQALVKNGYPSMYMALGMGLSW